MKENPPEKEKTEEKGGTIFQEIGHGQREENEGDEEEPEAAREGSPQEKNGQGEEEQVLGKASPPGDQQEWKKGQEEGADSPSEAVKPIGEIVGETKKIPEVANDPSHILDHHEAPGGIPLG